MEEKKIVEGNKAIALFMGYTPRTDLHSEGVLMMQYPCDPGCVSSAYIVDKRLDKYDEFMELQFHCDWSWLMPVVEKIHELYKAAFPTNERFIEMILAKEDPIDKEYMNVLALPVCTQIEEVWEEVVAFIHWHTTNKH